jgi:two-component system, response regulator PdtaR
LRRRALHRGFLGSSEANDSAATRRGRGQSCCRLSGGDRFGSGLRALVVDDEPFVRDLVADALRGCGFDVVAVDDGRTALRHLSRHAPDLVVTDWMMPRVNGSHVVSATRELLPSTPIVLITGNVDAARDGSDPADARLHLLPKPFGPKQLLDLARRVTPSAGH